MDSLEQQALIEGADESDALVAELVCALEMRGVRYPKYIARIAPDLDYLSESDLSVLDHVASEYGLKGFEELKNYTHGMAAYKNAWVEG